METIYKLSKSEINEVGYSFWSKYKPKSRIEVEEQDLITLGSFLEKNYAYKDSKGKTLTKLNFLDGKWCLVQNFWEIQFVGENREDAEMYRFNIWYNRYMRANEDCLSFQTHACNWDNSRFSKAFVHDSWDKEDSFGSAMLHLASVCDYLTAELNTDPPSEWGYVPGLGGPQCEGDEYETLQAFCPSVEQLLHVGNILHRLIEILKSKGEDYNTKTHLI